MKTARSRASWSRTTAKASPLRNRSTSGHCAARSPASSSWTRCACPEANRLPKVEGLKSALSCLTSARYGIAWGAVGAAQACFDEVIRYCNDRKIYDKPLGSFQITQTKLANMATEITKGQLLVWRLGRMKDAGQMRPQHVSMAKRNNVRMALDVARECRTLLGANGITLEYQAGRHACNLETVLTYEGTEEIHGLILGHEFTGHAAYGA